MQSTESAHLNDSWDAVVICPKLLQYKTASKNNKHLKADDLINFNQEVRTRLKRGLNRENNLGKGS